MQYHGHAPSQLSKDDKRIFSALRDLYCSDPSTHEDRQVCVEPLVKGLQWVGEADTIIRSLEG